MGHILLDSKTFAAIKHQIGQVKAKVSELKLHFKMNELLLAGCAQDQSSHDALFDEVPHRAMTYHALQTIRDMNYELTYEQLYDELSYRIEDARYPQTP